LNSSLTFFAHLTLFVAGLHLIKQGLMKKMMTKKTITTKNPYLEPKTLKPNGQLWFVVNLCRRGNCLVLLRWTRCILSAALIYFTMDTGYC